MSHEITAKKKINEGKCILWGAGGSMHLLESVTNLALTEPEREIKVFAVSEYKIGEIGVTLNKYFQCTHPLFLIVSQAHRLDRVG